LHVTPSDRCEVVVDVDYGEPPLPRGTASVVLGDGAFRRDVAWARTFALERDVERLRAAGRGGGASYENTVVVGEGGVVNPGGLRGEDEPVRHKLLDAIGDMALVGAPIRGRFEWGRGSHVFHHRALTAIFLAGGSAVG
jgi:UDP-3-O-[3-hydroxymyristoyl] N-acetylglucosamine deacetylase